jgi:hypothetical protein
MPKHEKKGLMIRFEKEPGTWGEWIVMPTGGGGGGRDDKLFDRQAELVALAEFYKTRGGNANKFVKTDGTNLVWADGDGVGDVTGPASSTDNAVALFNGTTGKVLKNGVVLGTMAQQDANAVDITGGTIDNASIGATTPSTVNATTITGQTARLNGTGQNLWLQSQTFGTTWVPFASSIPASDSTTAPNGTTTADTWTIDGTTAQHYIQQSATYVAGITYTFSVYVKRNTSDFIQMGAASGQFTSNAWANFNINTGAVGTVGAAATATITSAGNNWYRCTITATCTTAGSGNSFFAFIQSATDSRLPSFAGNSTDSLFLWGGQLEIASTVGTYIPTTTTAVYGTPTLSFSGVSSIGLLSNGALYLQPAGTGAIQAQATTSTTAGGNARGANAVDWQTSRDTAARVASGLQSVVVGGGSNTASAQYSSVLGGATNTASGFGAVAVNGNNNTASNTYTFLGGGDNNTNSGNRAFLGAGNSNTAAGFLNFIGGGQSNSGTANAAVTTQATTTVTSGSTAVTLSATNASIRVGQYITGTGIASFTYVAAISGTSLTLSQNATATGTPTLSFFTPHGVVVGGGNNQATGSYSFIGGGGDAGTAANRNVASGDWSFVGGGQANTASGVGAFIGGGGTTGSGAFANNSSGVASSILGGLGHTSSASGATVLGGYNNIANGARASVLGGRYGTTRAISGYVAIPASDAPIASLSGVSQSAILVLGRETTDATPTALCSTSSAAATGNQVILPNNSAYFFRGEVISGKTAAGDTKGWTIEGVIKRGANAASTALVGIPTVTSTYADLGAATWDIAVTADTTNGGIRVTFTGQAATTIRTVCQIRTTEMTF